jgi:hypothetical protein
VADSVRSLVIALWIVAFAAARIVSTYSQNAIPLAEPTHLACGGDCGGCRPGLAYCIPGYRMWFEDWKPVVRIGGQVLRTDDREPRP